jgi:hypothetical protein
LVKTCGSFSLTLLEGREKFALTMGDFQRAALRGHEPSSATLTKKRKGYFLWHLENT